MKLFEKIKGHHELELLLNFLLRAFDFFWDHSYREIFIFADA